MLDGFALVTGLRQSRYAKMIDSALGSIGVNNYDVVMELQESSAVKEMVRHGAGIACLPRCTVLGEIAAGSLVALPLSIPLGALDLHCAYRLPLSEMGQHLVRCLGNTAQRT
jgi:DNA-binding transcriptional LysR family regulator